MEKYTRKSHSLSNFRFATGSGGRLSAGREMPVIADGDGEQEKISMCTHCWKESAYCCGIGK